MRDLITRAWAGALFLLVMISGILVGHPYDQILFGLIVLLGMVEYRRLALPQSIHLAMVILSIVVFIIIALPLGTEPLLSSVVLALAVLILFLLCKDDAPLGLLGVLMTSVPFGLLASLPNGTTNGLPAVLYFFILLWTNDTLAYLSGRMFGKRPLAPSISPKKTWEGFWGGVIASMVLGWLFAPSVGLHGLTGIILGLAVGVLGTLGDLTESRLKRHFQVKDSGDLIPGHGGILDRFDSVLYAAPAFYLILQIG